MKTLIAALLLVAGALHADDPCTVDFIALYCGPLLIVTHNADGSDTIDDEAYQACAAWVMGVQ